MASPPLQQSAALTTADDIVGALAHVRTFRPIPYRSLACFLGRHAECICSPVRCAPRLPLDPLRREVMCTERVSSISLVSQDFDGITRAFDRELQD